MQGPHRISLFEALDLPKQMDPPPQPTSDSLEKINLNHCTLNNTHPDIMQEFINIEVYTSFKSTYTELFL